MRNNFISRNKNKSLIRSEACLENKYKTRRKESPETNTKNHELRGAGLSFSLMTSNIYRYVFYILFSPVIILSRIDAFLDEISTREYIM